MRQVDFMIAGAQKGGTSALNLVLRNHPDLSMCHVCPSSKHLGRLSLFSN